MQFQCPDYGEFRKRYLQGASCGNGISRSRIGLFMGDSMTRDSFRCAATHAYEATMLMPSRIGRAERAAGVARRRAAESVSGLRVSLPGRRLPSRSCAPAHERHHVSPASDETTGGADGPAPQTRRLHSRAPPHAAAGMTTSAAKGTARSNATTAPKPKAAPRLARKRARVSSKARPRFSAA